MSLHFNLYFTICNLCQSCAIFHWMNKLAYYFNQYYMHKYFSETNLLAGISLWFLPIYLWIEKWISDFLTDFENTVFMKTFALHLCRVKVIYSQLFWTKISQFIDYQLFYVAISHSTGFLQTVSKNRLREVIQVVVLFPNLFEVGGSHHQILGSLISLIMNVIYLHDHLSVHAWHLIITLGIIYSPFNETIITRRNQEWLFLCALFAAAGYKYQICKFFEFSEFLKSMSSDAWFIMQKTFFLLMIWKLLYCKIDFWKWIYADRQWHSQKKKTYFLNWQPN